MTNGIFAFIFIVGGSVYLIFEKPLVFWLIVLPLAVLILLKFVNWLHK